jgi:hypothetical protein
MTLHWIDAVAGVAYVCVRDRLPRFGEFLNAIESLIRHPQWRPGMPIVEDLREWRGQPPDNCLEDWRTYVADRHRFLEGCRWAVVRRADDRKLADILDAAGSEVPSGVLLRQFDDMTHAHVWAQRSADDAVAARFPVRGRAAADRERSDQQLGLEGHETA